MSSSSALGFLLLMTFPLLGGNDLLDIAATDAYWKGKGVEIGVEAMLGELRAKDVADISGLINQLGADQFREREAAMKAIRAAGPGVINQLQKAADGPDAEIADRAKTLIKQLGGGQLATAERRLMAIRTLGELKQREALPALEKLRAGKEPFVAEYAEAAIAAIEDKPLARPRPAQKQRDEDLHLLPKECVFVLQAGADQRIPVSWDQILRLVARIPKDQDPKATVAKYEKAFRTLLERAGNVRIDLATVGIGGHILAEEGFAIVVFRGKYHAAGFVEEAKNLGLAHIKTGGLDVIQHPTDHDAAVILGSDERLVLVASPSGLAPVETMVAAIKRGRGTFAENAKLAELVATVDRSKAVWAATMPDEVYRGLLGVESLESVTLEVAQDKEALTATCKVWATDFEKMKEKLDQITDMIRGAVASGMESAMPDNPHHMALVDLLKSLELTDDGKSFTITARAPNAAGLLMLPVVEGRRALE